MNAAVNAHEVGAVDIASRVDAYLTFRTAL